MIDLLNNLTLIFVHLIHNFELRFVDLKFRVLPTIGTIVNTGLDDWKEFQLTFYKGSAGYTATIGKSKIEVWTLVSGEWDKYTQYISDMVIYTTAYDAYEVLFAQWQIDVQSDPELVAPNEPDAPVRSWVIELTNLFEYIDSIGVK